MYQYQVSFGDAIKRAYSHYFDFSGRASLSEYWWFALYSFILSIVIMIPLTVIASITYMDPNVMQIIVYIILLPLTLPGLALTVRRLHDTGRGGGWIFIALIPIVGAIILLVFELQPSENGENRFGEMPNLTY